MEDNLNVKVFYENIKEDEREQKETLEFHRSKSIISRYLPHNPIDIADICGATGAYSFWLAAMGHRVHLLDLMQSHIDTAKEKSRQSGILLASYHCADARALPYTDQSMDMVLLMGALYHLHTHKARQKCLAEAFRVLKPGGLIICTVMNRFGLIIAAQKYKLFDNYSREYLEDSFNTGIHDKANFYTHTPDEIAAEVSAAGFESTQLIAIEGFANALSSNQLPADEREVSRLLWSIELTESVPSLIGVTRNIMAISKKPS